MIYTKLSLTLHMLFSADGVTYSFGVFYDVFLDYFQEGKGATSWINSILVGVTLCSGMNQHYVYLYQLLIFIPIIITCCLTLHIVMSGIFIVSQRIIGDHFQIYFSRRNWPKTDSYQRTGLSEWILSYRMCFEGIMWACLCLMWIYI